MKRSMLSQCHDEVARACPCAAPGRVRGVVAACVRAGATVFVPVLVVTAGFLGSGCSSRESNVIPHFDATRAIAAAHHQCAFGPRVPGSAARDSVAAYIAGSLARHGAKVESLRFAIDDPWSNKPLHLVNIVGHYAPSRRHRIVLASHYDSRPWADEDTSAALRAQPVPGAVDGAASAGILLEIARLLGERMPGGPGIDLVFFDGEDYGRPDNLSNYLLGSRHYVAKRAGHRPPDLVILLDMVGGRGTRVAREGYSLANSPEYMDAIFARAEALGLTTFLNVAAPSIYDDHVPFIEAGIHAIDLFGYGYPSWHTTRDLPDQIDLLRVSETGRLVVSFLYDPPH